MSCVVEVQSSFLDVGRGECHQNIHGFELVAIQKAEVDGADIADVVRLESELHWVATCDVDESGVRFHRAGKFERRVSCAEDQNVFVVVVLGVSWCFGVRSQEVGSFFEFEASLDRFSRSSDHDFASDSLLLIADFQVEKFCGFASLDGNDIRVESDVGFILDDELVEVNRNGISFWIILLADFSEDERIFECVLLLFVFRDWERGIVLMIWISSVVELFVIEE